jgi:hypothetical protein
MNNRYIVNYDSNAEVFTLNDTEEQCMIILTKEQLEALIKLYRQCCYEK